MDIDEINDRIKNNPENLDHLKGFETIAEALVYKIYDTFGRNLLLNLLYQIGSGPGEIIAKLIKERYGDKKYDVLGALEVLVNELNEYYSVQLKSIEEDDEKIKLIIENHCFLRKSMKRRKRLEFGKAFCRVPKGYFEVAFKKLLGDEITNVEINFLENDEEKDACIEELIFYKNPNRI